MKSRATAWFPKVGGKICYVNEIRFSIEKHFHSKHTEIIPADSRFGFQIMKLDDVLGAS